MPKNTPKHRFYIPPDFIKKDTAIICPPEYHHLVDVLRHKKGDSVSLFDGKGNEFVGKVVSIDHSAKEVRLNIKKIDKLNHQLQPFVLIQSLIKSSNMDFIIHKATELGVTNIIPIITDYSVVKLDQKQRAKKHAKWQRIIIEAAKQCGRAELPVLGMVKNYQVALNEFSWIKDKFICTLLDVPKEGIAVRGNLSTTQSAAVLIGPEGGFSKKEVDFAVASKWMPISLGRNRLKAETAAIVALGVLGRQLGFWEQK